MESSGKSFLLRVKIPPEANQTVAACVHRGRKVRAAQSGMTANGRTLKAGNSIRRGIGPQRRVSLFREVDVKRGNLHLQQYQIGWHFTQVIRRGSRCQRVDSLSV